MSLPLDQSIAIVALMLFFLVGLLTGIWKFRHMHQGPNHEAPYYVNIAHRTALLYSFAMLVVLEMARLSAHRVALDALGVMLLVVFFGSAIATYIGLGFRNNTDNQFKQGGFAANAGMWLLIIGELSGFAILASGVLLALFT